MNGEEIDLSPIEKHLYTLLSIQQALKIKAKEAGYEKTEEVEVDLDKVISNISEYTGASKEEVKSRFDKLSKINPDEIA